jgi:hypothetical protein
VKAPALLAFVAAALGLTACNVFDPFDSPTGDAQLLSAARACLDRADFGCARENYAKLSNSESEVRASEEAFAILEENGAGIGPLMSAIGDNPNIGPATTKLAGSMANGASAAKVTALFEALKKVNQIPNNPQLRGLVRFASTFAMAAESLALDAGRTGSPTVLDKTDITTQATVASCQSTGVTCTAPAGAILLAGAYGGSLTATTITASAPAVPTLGFVSECFNAVLTAFQNELGAKGDYSSMQNSAALLAGQNGDPVRGLLLQEGIGQ